MESGGGNPTDDIDAMFSDLLGEMDLLTQSLGVETLPSPTPSSSSQNTDFQFSFGFSDVKESLNSLEDTDFDALMADLMADIDQTEEICNAKATSAASQTLAAPEPQRTSDMSCFPAQPVHNQRPPEILKKCANPPALACLEFPPPPTEPPEPLTEEEKEARAKADKIKLALEKLKEAKVKKLVVKVLMNDKSSKTLMVDETQTVREILDNLFEKSHCDCNVDWCLYEVNPDLQIERFLEDDENMVETLSLWMRDSENKLLFVEQKEKYAVFKNPQNFFIAKKKDEGKDMKEKRKEALLEECFCGTSIIVPDLESALFVKEDGKKSWKRRYFLLRASGIYYVPKGKTKTSSDLICFIQFENVNVYYGMQYKAKYKAPTDYCFVLKHPQIQKESQYIKYLCCDDRWNLQQWVTGIRIAKYGKTLYNNHKIALQKAGLASQWINLTNIESNNTASTIAASPQPNGQAKQMVNQVSSVIPDTWKRTEGKKTYDDDEPVLPPPPPPPLEYEETLEFREGDLPPPPPSFELPPVSAPTSREYNPPCSPTRPVPCMLLAPTSTKPKDPGKKIPPIPPKRLSFVEPPPDFLPPPPPCFNSSSAAASIPPPPPPPPPPSSNPSLSKQPNTGLSKPAIPKRIENKSALPPRGGPIGQPDIMSDLMKVLQKKKAALGE
ncbi:amyloid beta A4 precursor protein-binding family B member 1-interacting protein [Callorhinchus milii]|uniref:Amyloid beta A4 precursor protein-binding family B member 1-interacting protein n=1 Tax=Callorhinchus milii TaxID=7868 RepID=A0A4W3GI79_CALMI|nr:amyloid beta A4 precursor protein-binding family B member 1-interacting protein [Callorhinchus milii]XP_007899364.1 amyloid beta A4 precursor protein-binding family B member 1-interacting protein [Callorhinchus milii]XP_007899365.1 amyloid beta A4 precursor protein-binding family B member 1-interacting protein [Callorhinchus milii]|eukprot:gi/632966337/ref/XP_007899363.1/ PREDICTED: amyloid beta A4 precursor protein-binding family B member 1-interacting protein [Callorhinchus milii]